MSSGFNVCWIATREAPAEADEKKRGKKIRKRNKREKIWRQWNERKKERNKETNKQTNAEANAPRPSEPTKRPAKRSVDDEWGQRSKSNWPIKNKRRRKETRPAPFWKWKEINNTLPKLGNKTEREREREREKWGET